MEETGTVLSRRNLSVNYNRLGNIARAQGRLGEAKEYYEKGLEISLALAKETGTVLSRQDLSISYERLGIIARAQGRLGEAKEHYEKCLEIRLVLAKEAVTLQTIEDLQIAYYNYGVILLKLGAEKGRAKEMFQRVVQVGEDSGHPRLKKLADQAKTILSQYF